MIPESFIEELKYASDIEDVVSSYVGLKRKGRHLSGLCPFHSEKTPSFVVYPDNQSYYCFGCGNGGDVITFVRNIENLEYIEALRFLAARAGLQLPEDANNDRTVQLKIKILEINRETARFFHNRLMSPQGKPALDYLVNRGLAIKTIRGFGLGFAPDSWDMLRNHLAELGYSQEEMLAAAVVTSGKNNSVYDAFRGRVMFPIIDLRGGVIGFGGRAMEDRGPKYLNSADTLVFKKSRNLFALNFAKAQKSDMLILGEGYMDVIAMHQAGFQNAVATLGTSLTEEQSRLISQYAKRVVIAYDSDSAGQTATKRAINLFSNVDVQVTVLEIKDAKDPDEFIKKFGAQRFAGLLNTGKGAVRFEIDKLKKNHDLATAEGTVAFLNDFCKLMAGIDNDIERGVYIGETARELDMEKRSILSTVEAQRKKRYRAQQKKAAHNVTVYAQDNAGSRASPRKEGLAGLVAEEKLLAALMKNPDYFEDVDERLSPEDFILDTNREIYAAIAEKLRRQQVPEMIALAESLPPLLMSKLAGTIAGSRDLHFEKQQVFEYIQVIKSQKTAKSAEDISKMDPAELQRYLMQQKKMQK